MIIWPGNSPADTSRIFMTGLYLYMAYSYYSLPVMSPPEPRSYHGVGSRGGSDEASGAVSALSRGSGSRATAMSLALAWMPKQVVIDWVCREV